MVAITEHDQGQTATERYNAFAVAAAGEPLSQAAAANVNPWTEDKVDSKNAHRGLLLIGDGDANTVPWAIANASYTV